MEDKLRAYMDHLFREAEPTKKAVELKEEILQNLCDKYRDLIAEGKSPEAAYNITVAGIGDPKDLLAGLEEDSNMNITYTREEIERNRRKSAILVSIAVILYIMCVIPVIIQEDILGICIMFGMIAIATGILIFNSMTKIHYIKSEDTLVEDFKEWQEQSSDNRNLRRAISSALWAITVAVYFLVSFTTFAWHVTWIIFLIAVAINAVISAVFELRK